MNKKAISKVLLISSSHLDYIIIGAEQFKLSDFLAVIVAKLVYSGPYSLLMYIAVIVGYVPTAKSMHASTLISEVIAVSATAKI